jgi:hypothetical protein
MTTALQEETGAFSSRPCAAPTNSTVHRLSLCRQGANLIWAEVWTGVNIVTYPES